MGAAHEAPDPFALMDATEQARLVRAGDVTPSELVEAAISRIQRLDPKIRALASSAFDLARERARSGTRSRPLAGVPTLIKDLMPYPGHSISYGSRLFEAMAATAGSEYTAALERSGLIVLGKSATSEFGLLGTTETLLNGATRNPWNFALSAGGSSGGAASAVASETEPPPIDTEVTSKAFFALTGVLLAGMLDRSKAIMGEAFDEDAIEPYTQELIHRSRELSVDAVEKAVFQLHAAERSANAHLAYFDVLMSPTVPYTAFPLGEYPPTADFEKLIAFTERAGYTFAASLGGWLAMVRSTPLGRGWTADRLPFCGGERA
jgi:Asp-tRNA(Asn)/Glu-tRNA(Gln) amidotransferase A subunit family amidase